MREALLRVILLSLALAFPFGSLALAQSQSLGSTMDVFVFPAQGQDSSQQSKDEAACALKPKNTWSSTSGRAFSFVIDEATGHMTVAVSRDGLSVSVFGACTDADI